MGTDLSKFFQAFFEETAEHLAEIETLLLTLNVSSPAMDNLNAIFRAAHSIKGGAGTFGFTDMIEVTHVLETLLDRLRKQQMTLTAEMVNVFLEAKDVIAMQLAAHRGEGEVAADAVSKVCEKLERLASNSNGTDDGSHSGDGLGGGGSSGYAGADSASSDYDSGFFDDQPGAPASEQVVPKGNGAPIATANTKLPEHGTKIELHGQGFGFFDDEPATPPKQFSVPGSSVGQRSAEIPPRKEIPGAGPISERAVTGAAADTDFGFFDDQPGAPTPAQNAPKTAAVVPAKTDADAADQKTKRDFHGDGYGFF